MKVYRIKLRNSKGDSFCITVTASSLYEAMKRIEFSFGLHFVEYSVIGGAR